MNTTEALWNYLENVGFPFKKSDEADVDASIRKRMTALVEEPCPPPMRVRGYFYGSRPGPKCIAVNTHDHARFQRDFPPNAYHWIKSEHNYYTSVITDLVGDNERERLSTVVDGRDSAYTIYVNEMRASPGVDKRRDRRMLSMVVRASSRIRGSIPYALREAFYKVIKEASVFGPLPVRMLIEHVGATSVLDPCAGWGDRLIGALSVPSVRKYIGFDPNAALQPAYTELIERFSDGREFAVVEGCAEVHIPQIGAGNNAGNARFDLVVTSPPYYRKEIYQRDNPLQSSAYESLDAWKTGFLYPTIRASWDVLSAGGSMIIHICDLGGGVASSVEPFTVVEDMLRFMKRELSGFEWVGVIMLSGRLEMPCWHVRKRA